MASGFQEQLELTPLTENHDFDFNQKVKFTSLLACEVRNTLQDYIGLSVALLISRPSHPPPGWHRLTYPDSFYRRRVPSSSHSLFGGLYTIVEEGRCASTVSIAQLPTGSTTGNYTTCHNTLTASEGNDCRANLPYTTSTLATANTSIVPEGHYQQGHTTVAPLFSPIPSTASSFTSIAATSNRHHNSYNPPKKPPFIHRLKAYLRAPYRQSRYITCCHLLSTLLISATIAGFTGLLVIQIHYPRRERLRIAAFATAASCGVANCLVLRFKRMLLYKETERYGTVVAEGLSGVLGALMALFAVVMFIGGLKVGKR